MVDGERPLLVVRLRVEPEKEEEFNEWYAQYLDTLKPLAPDFVSIRRFVTEEEGERTYLTIYEIKDNDSVDSAMGVFDLPERQSYRREWQAWEESHLHDVSANIYRQIYPK